MSQGRNGNKKTLNRCKAKLITAHPISKYFRSSIHPAFRRDRLRTILLSFSDNKLKGTLVFIGQETLNSYCSYCIAYYYLGRVFYEETDHRD